MDAQSFSQHAARQPEEAAQVLRLRSQSVLLRAAPAVFRVHSLLLPVKREVPHQAVQRLVGGFLRRDRLLRDGPRGHRQVQERRRLLHRPRGQPEELAARQAQALHMAPLRTSTFVHLRAHRRRHIRRQHRHIHRSLLHRDHTRGEGSPQPAAAAAHAVVDKWRLAVRAHRRVAPDDA